MADAKKDTKIDAETGEERQKLKLKKEALRKGVKALCEVVKKKSSGENSLFDDAGETMVLLFTLGQIPDRKKVRPVLIDLPHPLYNEKSEVCFFCKDPQKKYKEMLLEQFPLPGLVKVIGIDKLRKNYKSLEAKRALKDAFDLFVCDSAIYDMLPSILGKTFWQAPGTKTPIPVRMNADPRNHIKKAMSGIPFRPAKGPCCSVRIGRCSMPEEHLVENAAAVVGSVVRNLKGNPIKTISVQATGNLALPVWRRQDAPGGAFDFKKYHSDASSAASDTGVSGVSETEGGMDSELPSDVGETISTRDTVSEPDTTAGDTTLSELDSEAGDVDSEAVEKSDLPLLTGLKKRGKKRRGELEPEVAKKAEKAAAKEVAKPEETKASMGPPTKKAKKKGGKA